MTACGGGGGAAALPVMAVTAPPQESRGAQAGGAQGEASAQSELNEAMKIASPAARVERLEAFVRAHAESPLRMRGAELLTVARAALGDELLRTGNPADGIEQFRRAVAEAPADMPEKLFVEVVSQLPANLSLRGEGAAALELARRIEEKVAGNASRLLAVAAFYLSAEQGTEAARVAELAIRLAPDMAAAHQALGLAHRIALRLEPAATAFARAVELDPRSVSARRNLADLYRAAGRTEDALRLYRELLTPDPKDAGARAGVVLALFDSGQREAAESELATALTAETQNLSLLVGAAYWYAAHAEGARALELAEQAVRAEPRYTWAQIAFARALLAQKRPLDAERALRIARQYGRFPTLDYELAGTLAAAGLYEEAAEELARSFIIRDGEIETQLAGRIPARAADFITLLAPERRASIYQAAAADTAANARILKGLLAFHLAMKGAGEPAEGGELDEVRIARAAEDFTAAADGGGGADEMRTFRQLYIAERLLQRGVALPAALAAVEASIESVDAALAAPAAPVAVLADSLRDIRARAIAGGATTNLPAIPRNVLSNIVRGRIEDLAGWILFSQGKAAEAVVRLRRAVSVLPEPTLWWRDAMWHLGTALDASGNSPEALTTLMRSYDRQAPNPVRRAVIEALYARVHGSLQGLDAKLGAAAPPVVAAPTTPDTHADAKTALRVSEDRTTPDRAADRGNQIGAPPDETLRPEAETARTAEEEKASDLAATGEAARTPATELPITTTTAESTPAPPAASTLDVAPPGPETSDAASDSESIARTSAAVTANTTAAAPAAPEAKPAGDAPQPGSGSSSGDGRCLFSVSEEALTIGRGGSASLVIGFDDSTKPAAVTATTPNWADIVVLAEPQVAASSGGGSLKYTISSVSTTAGTFIVTFSSPCGSKKVPVRVK